MLADRLFLDSAYPIALASIGDQHHAAAMQVGAQVKAISARMITTRAVLLEIGNALAKPGFRTVAVELLRTFEHDPQIEVVSLDDSLYQRGFELFGSREAKTWSLTDCISFVVIRERGLNDALTSDQHFEQAGFTALLRR